MPRSYPAFPRVGVGAVVTKDENVLLIKRRFEPKAGKWTLPGGLVNVGETLQQAVRREISEECGIQINPKRIIDVLDVIEEDDQHRIKYHYVVVDFEAEYISGTAVPGSDVTEVKWVPRSRLTQLNLPESTRDFFLKHRASL